MTPQSSISRFPTGLHELKIKGEFSHPHWMAFLFAGLSAVQISVVSGRATRTGSGWDARLMLDFARSETVPESLDAVALALQKPDKTDGAAPRISQFRIARRADESLEVWVDGPDQIGFLGRVLGRMSLVMLFPIEIEINTISSVIHDRFVFRGIGGVVPSDAAQKSLDSLLQFCVIVP